MRLLINLLLFLLIGCNVSAQSLKTKILSTQRVFNKLVQAYGNSKIAPALKVLPKTQQESVIAAFVSKPNPIIKIDEKVIDICLSLKDDSLNALSAILSHELAHYYNEHTFCNDYSFVKSNSELQNAIKREALSNRKEKEAQADTQGLWYAAMAGFKPLEAFDNVIDIIYKQYNLKEANPGYPSKTERKELNKVVKANVSKLIPVFDAGFILNQMGYFDEAIDCFDNVLQYFPSKETYNNAGLARLAKVLINKPKESVPYIYPIQIDANSMLRNNYKSTGSKGIDDINDSKNIELLKQAKLRFEKAIAIDPSYYEANLNLAILNSVRNNHEAAIGILNNLEIENLKSENLILVKALAYLKLENRMNADKQFKLLANSKNAIITHNLKLFELSSQPKVLLSNYLKAISKQDDTMPTSLIIGDTANSNQILTEKAAQIPINNSLAWLVNVK
jgi:tetratricopeptide (TPR) repeat protein